MLRIMVEATFTTDNRTGEKWYGPIALPENTAPNLYRGQRNSVCRMSRGTQPFFEGCFFGWLNVHDTMQGMLWL